MIEYLVETSENFKKTMMHYMEDFLIETFKITTLLQ